MFYYVVSPRITIEDLETKGAAALLPQAKQKYLLFLHNTPWKSPIVAS